MPRTQVHPPLPLPKPTNANTCTSTFIVATTNKMNFGHHPSSLPAITTSHHQQWAHTTAAATVYAEFALFAE
jgi:hypothetical protein